MLDKSEDGEDWRIYDELDRVLDDISPGTAAVLVDSDILGLVVRAELKLTPFDWPPTPSTTLVEDGLDTTS